ncbi:peroxidase family protein [Kocuria turfanensis]|uniref:Myeloperoxidase n=1 Tax=Kocuria turfanensis TaxID=388357 RepID=A0A512I9J1_9MICC|nr:heme peroxidase family protein [Kocuria turfanensis]GEO94365.1 myeloperoxidase [Kocuria turfanensis]
MHPLDTASTSAAATDGPGLSRRGVLAGLAAGLVALPAAGATPAHAAPRAPVTTPAGGVLSGGGGHGAAHLRGADIAVTAGRKVEGRFGVMFPKLPAFAPDDALLEGLAHRMIDRTPPLSDVSLSNDGFDNPDMPAGFAYLGQFIDHDMTLDLTPLPEQQVDPTGLTNFDTPFFDLGSVYGRGPAADPQLYDPADPRRMRLGRTSDGLPDLPRRADGTAVIGDHRNDENLIVCQLHLAFLLLHNGFVDSGASFEEARRLTRWHFQWLIVHDFLPHVVGRPVVEAMLRADARGAVTVDRRFYRPGNPHRPMMPIEYSVGAYRFGHSMVRAEYEMHDEVTIPFFGSPGHDLRGSRPIPSIARIDWNYFFEIPGTSAPDDRNLTRLIDTKLALPLAELPPTVVKHVDGAILNLAQRNLLRGKRLGLPAGQDVARAMGVAPIPNDRLGLTERGWSGKAPLWFYVLKEAELLGGRTLGPVGGRIVAEVILGVLALDRSSFLNAPTAWAPASTPFACGDLLRMAGVVQEGPGAEENELPEEQGPEGDPPEEAAPGT